MSWAEPHPPSLLVRGDLRFVELHDLSSLLRSADAAGLLTVQISSLGPALRGRLALQLEGTIEAALLRGGACPPGVGAAASVADSLSDQLYRARLIERRGIVLAMPSLDGLADAQGALDPDDSALLRFLLEATARLPLQLWLEPSSAELKLYGPPQPLLAFGPAPRSATPAPEAALQVAPEVVASTAAMELTVPVLVEARVAVVEEDGALSFSEALAEADQESPEAPSVAAAAELRDVRPGPSPIGDLAQAVVQSLLEAPAQEHEHAVASAAEEAPEPVTLRRTPTSARRPAAEAAAAVARPPLAVEQNVPPLYPNAEQEWRGWLSDLLSARGPKPLGTIERMFVSSYVPLRIAALQGHADAGAQRALDTWSESFAQSYREAFDALRVRGKRPTMVLDVPELALRIGRLHGARSVQLVLVDGMRFDLGLRVEQRVRALLGQQAALTERLLLWSALPSTTEAQIELIGRGAEGLREPLSMPEVELPVARGRAATTLRRVKAGHRDLLKLDLVESHLSEPGPAEGERLDQLASETAAVLADHLVKQMPRTLVFAFGDHGFLLDPLEDGTAAARRGGGSPEEVLVPAFAWLVGGVH